MLILLYEIVNKIHTSSLLSLELAVRIFIHKLLLDQFVCSRIRATSLLDAKVTFWESKNLTSP